MIVRFNCQSSGKSLSEGSFVLSWPVGVSGGDYLTVLVDVGSCTLRVSSTILWVWVLHIKSREHKLSSRHYVSIFSLFLTVGVTGHFKFLP